MDSESLQLRPEEHEQLARLEPLIRARCRHRPGWPSAAFDGDDVYQAGRLAAIEAIIAWRTARETRPQEFFGKFVEFRLRKAVANCRWQGLYLVSVPPAHARSVYHGAKGVKTTRRTRALLQRGGKAKAGLDHVAIEGRLGCHRGRQSLPVFGRGGSDQAEPGERGERVRVALEGAVQSLSEDHRAIGLAIVRERLEVRPGFQTSPNRLAGRFGITSSEVNSVERRLLSQARQTLQAASWRDDRDGSRLEGGSLSEKAILAAASSFEGPSGLVAILIAAGRLLQPPGLRLTLQALADLVGRTRQRIHQTELRIIRRALEGAAA